VSWTLISVINAMSLRTFLYKPIWINISCSKNLFNKTDESSAQAKVIWYCLKDKGYRTRSNWIHIFRVLSEFADQWYVYKFPVLGSTVDTTSKTTPIVWLVPFYREVYSGSNVFFLFRKWPMWIASKKQTILYENFHGFSKYLQRLMQGKYL
jgi:hypothetical protein